jgi:hypothetical protein
MVALGIEGGRKSEYVGGAKLDAEAASLAALDGDRDKSFGHGESPRHY